MGPLGYPGAGQRVGPVVFLFPGWQFGLTALAAVRDDKSGARVAAAGDREGVADCGLGAGLLPRLAVVAVPGQRPADHDDQPGVGVVDDLVVGGVPIVLRPLGQAWSQVGTRVPSTMSTASLANRLRGRRANIGPRWSMIRSAADFDAPNSGASCGIVRLVRQQAASSRARSASGRLHVRPLRTASAPSRRSTLTSFPNCRGLSPVNGAIQEGSDAVITPAIARSSQAG